MTVITHKYLVDTLQQQGCTLLTTEYEYTQVCKTDKNLKVRILAVCGHERDCLPHFLKKRSFLLCKACTILNTRKLLKEKHNNESELCQNIEFNGYLHVYQYIENHFEVKKTHEGCLSDFIIRERKNAHLNDKWIGVQLKTTLTESYGMYSFHIQNNYQDNIIMCNCVKDDKLWIMPYNVLSHLKHLSISSNKSKYNQYLVSSENVYDRILILIADMKTFTSEELLTPISKAQIQEQTYSSIRIQYVPFLQYLKPNIENGKVDFYVGSKKFQEKVSVLRCNKYNLVCLYVNNGKENGARKYRMYRLGENDFYWFHIKDTFTFYVVPELVLFQHKCISNVNETLNKKILNIDTNQEWLSDYKFDYKSVDKIRLLQLLQISDGS